MVAGSSTVNANIINFNSTGLTSPQTTIDFGNGLHTDGTVITTQFADVTFATDGDPWHYKQFPSGEFHNGIELGHLTRGGVAHNPTSFSIEFDSPVTGAAFNMRSFPGNVWTVTSSRNGVTVETFNLVGATDPDITVRFYGFENSNFDTLTITSTVNDAGFELDNLQFFSSPTCVLPPSGLIGWWDGDAVSGSTAADIQAGNDGVLVGDTTTAPGKVGNAFSFDGAGDYIQLPIDSGVIPNQFTIDAWVFPTKLTPFAFLQGILDNDTTPGFGPARGVSLSVFGGVPIESNPVQVTGVFHNPDEVQHITFPHVVTTANAWHHYALTYNATQLCLYQDGQIERCVAAAGLVIDNDVNFRIGHGQADTSPERFFGGLIDEVEIYDRALTSTEILAIFDAGTAGKCKGAVNEPPTANAGDTQTIHAGDLVILNGSGSSDDTTPTEDLVYAWSFVGIPAGSGAALSGAATSSPNFTSDLPGDYVVSLVVKDEQGFSSAPDTVTVSSLNSAPNANAGGDQGATVNDLVVLNGSGSNDPDDDPLSFAWSIIGEPAGSTVVLNDANIASASFIPELPGAYFVQVIVNDGLVDSTPDVATITVITAEEFAEVSTVASINTVVALPPTSVTTTGNQKALGNSLSQVISSLQDGNVTKAIKKLEQAIARTDGCALRGKPDAGGGGGGNPPEKDYIDNCTDQNKVYPLLVDALTAISP